MASNILSIDECKSYSTEANLHKALSRLGLDDWAAENEVACRYIVARNSEGRWTAIFLASEYFARNKTGGYVGFASQHGFMSI